MIAMLLGCYIYNSLKNPHQPEAEKQYSSEALLLKMNQSFSKSDDLLTQLQTALIKLQTF